MSYKYDAILEQDRESDISTETKNQIFVNQNNVDSLSGKVSENTTDIDNLSGEWNYADSVELNYSPSSGYTEINNTVSGHLSGIANKFTEIEQWSSVPTLSSSPGINGQRAVDDNYIYYCIADNKWVRSALDSSF